jgi:hypothetical protein
MANSFEVFIPAQLAANYFPRDQNVRWSTIASHYAYLPKKIINLWVTRQSLGYSGRKIRAQAIVIMEECNVLTSRQLKTRIPIRGHWQEFRMTVVTYPGTEFLHNLRGIIIGCIVHHDYLKIIMIL